MSFGNRMENRLRRRFKGKRRAKFRLSRSLAVQRLERRWLLASVVAVSPSENANSAAANSPISAEFDESVVAETVTANSFSIHGGFSGRLLDPSFSVVDNRASVQPNRLLLPGEVVQVSTTNEIHAGADATPVDSFLWQFRAAASGGTGYLGDSGQELGENESQAVALGDIDGDGDLDAVVGNIGANAVWTNDGSGKFTDTGQLLGVSTTYSVALGDIDGDGDLDILDGNLGQNELWINDGSGRFDSSGAVFLDETTCAVALGDIDGDGDQDAVFANDGPNTVFLNDGNGLLVDSGQRLGIGESRAVALGDLDGDGDLDAFVSNAGSNRENQLWFNNGNGQFIAASQSLGSKLSYSVALGDLDGDGDLDVYVGNRGRDEVWLNTNGFPGVLQLADQHLPGSAITRSVALGDLDGDGDLDVLTGASSSPSRTGQNRVWINESDGTLVRLSPILGDRQTHSVALGDLDGDGDLDAMTANRREEALDENSNRVWLNAEFAADLSIDITNSQGVSLPGGSTNYVVTVSNDGPESVDGAVVTSQFSPHITNVRWTCVATEGSRCAPTGTSDIQDRITIEPDGQIIYTAVADILDSATGTVSSSTTVEGPNQFGDIGLANNRDVDVDVIPPRQLSPSANSNAVATNSPVSITYRGDVDPISVFGETITVHGRSVGRLNEDHGQLDVDGETVTFRPSSELPAGELFTVTSMGVHLGDERESSEPFTWQFRTQASNGTGFFSDSGQLLGFPSSNTTQFGDLDQDGDLDAFVTSRWEGYEAVWLNDGLGNYQSTGQSVDVPLADDAALGDLDGDGDLDAIVAGPSGFANRPGTTIWLNDGKGNFGGNWAADGRSLQRCRCIRRLGRRRRP